ncbi:phospholipid-binding lipoprotein MlaA [Malonomonas rubra DSM 5091]|uniref:Phospholipid-binding lipoprotein MlaA n=1 Tax=Malonomonas rubra DSM 5091 TaxID=1122189 RepID=A0A1M6M6W4_MALRU|nr:VacJ family lipoprotein [Malonomonas rubra]SHJ79246.1 phospholipid-binding lipoprotein MlaA [Malonomonas rubra DSM 5091]
MLRKNDKKTGAVRVLAAVLLVLSLTVSSLWAADKGGVKTQVIPAGQINDQFDADFADDFDNEFDDAGDVEEILISDPLEPLNRGFFWFNDKLYFYLMKPVARGYRLILPQSARIAVGNAFYNVATPVRAANDVMQFKFKSLATELYRFIVNSTVGLGGLFDPAAKLAGVEKVDDEDFGQTLGYYGTGHGFYLVLPVIGPSSARDAVGSLVDTFADPIRYANITTLEYYGVKSFRVVNSLSLDRDTYEGIVRDSLDPYLFVRAAYAQRRTAQIGKVDYNLYDILTFEDDFWDEDFNPFKWLGN